MKITQGPHTFPRKKYLKSKQKVEIFQKNMKKKSD